MLKLYEFDDLKLERLTAHLENASQVKVVHEINGVHELSFYYPPDEKSRLIKENALVVCEGQAFRIMRVSSENAKVGQISVKAMHVYNADAAAVHLQNVPDCIGVKPTEVLRLAFSNTPFTLLSDSEIAALGMTSVDSDGFLIDFFSADKTTPYDVMNEVIKNCGKGEIYTDNYKIALVERLGNDNGVRLSLEDNMSNINVERDMSSLITRLYPYGFEDMHIGSVNSSVQYIDSPNIKKYGIREGFKDYSDYRDPADILSRGQWEFDPRNEERIDIPSINITASVIDLSRISGYDFFKLGLGDRVRVIYGDDTYYERVIKTEYYPFEPLEGEVSIGRVKKDLFFYLNQIGAVKKQYNRVSTSNGKVAASAISGIVSADGVKVKDSSGNVTIMTDMLSMSDSSGLRFRCGLSSGSFVFDLYCGSERVLYVSGSELYIKAAGINIKNASLTADSEGHLLVNGNKVG
ncbi:MAG: prophage endopeptidase tail family protein [Clostridiales bacterium]|nr:prophage endopeptidase tail family protein [Clostridiales bacterium]